MVTEITLKDIKPNTLVDVDENVHVVMFYGATCGPCKASMPHYENVANVFTELGAKMKFHKIHAWEEGELKKYCEEVWKIQGVPNFKVFYEGSVFTERLGGGDEIQMNQFIHSIVDDMFKQKGVKI